MSYTNKTPNYDLPQYVSTDKPTYLGDFNETMLKIDTALKNNETSADSGNSSAETANATAQSALTTATNAESKATSADTKATDAKSTAQSAQTSANNANTAVNKLIAKFDLSNITTISSENMTNYQKETSTIDGSIGDSSTITIASNNDGSIAKIYGYISIENMSSPTNTQFTLKIQSNLRPSKKFTINNAIFTQAKNQTTVHQYNNLFQDLTIDTNGEISINFINATSQGSYLQALPFLYFITDFGDTPQPASMFM